MPQSPSDNPPPSLRSAYAAARHICRTHARSFYFASAFLPKSKRERAYAVYAFCRGIDDAVDTGDAREVDGRYAAFARTLDGIYEGRVETAGLPELQALAQHAFADTVKVCGIPKQLFLDLAAGCRMDLTIDRYATWPELERYCYHVAGVVGLIMCHVFELRDPSAAAAAVAMGNAMQLTNILRDIEEDWARGRVYLPAEDLERFGVTEQHLASRLLTPGVVELMRFEIARARELYRTGACGLHKLPNDGSRLTASVMAVVYAGILDAIERQGCNPFAGRARLSLMDKVRRVPAAWRLARRGTADHLPDAFASRYARGRVGV